MSICPFCLYQVKNDNYKSLCCKSTYHWHCVLKMTETVNETCIACKKNIFCGIDQPIDNVFFTEEYLKTKYVDNRFDIDGYILLDSKSVKEEIKSMFGCCIDL